MRNKTVGQKLRELRTSQNLFLRQVAASLELDTALLSKIERDERQPSKSQVLDFAKFYKVNPDDLLVSWLSDKVVSDIGDEDLARQVLREAEGKLELLRKTKKNTKSK